jgi:hypothetical protein
MGKLEIRKANVSRYVVPLREGGSLPAIIEADDGFSYVMKFRGAGQGKKALIAELIGGELARSIGLKVPEIIFLELDESFSKSEPDEEIQDLLRFSVGLNLGLHFLSGAITLDPLVGKVDPLEASKVVLLDSIITNVDRTARNTNMLIWNKELWLIDHGASLYFHHTIENWKGHLDRTFPAIRHHVLLSRASEAEEARVQIINALKEDKIKEIVSLIPEEWLEEEGQEISVIEKKDIYVEFILSKLNNIELLTKEIQDAKEGNI